MFTRTIVLLSVRMGARNDTRVRMIQAAKTGFRANGMVATGFSEILETSGAARGAIYHHFPGGKEELAVEVVRSTGDNVATAIRELFAASPSPRAALASAIELVAAAVDAHEGFGCAVAPAVLEAAGSAAILHAGHEAFVRWQAAIEDAVGEQFGADAADVAALVVSAIEGALILSRADGSSEPLRRTGRALVAALEH
jgi:TetR/AcrR family transcriptional repressor of lmrAB and yxaGH operons